jgi:glycine/D-amino acid oxidase-like deaminating enzyme
MVESLAIWKTAGGGDGRRLGFRQTGVLYLAKTEAEIAGFEAWTEHARAHQLDTRLLTPGDAARC